MSPDRVRRKRQRGASLTAAPPPREATKVFYAVAEGRVTEYDYLTVLQNTFAERCSFRIDMPRPSSRRDDMTPSRVAEHAVAVAEDDDSGPRGQYEEIWAIFDRDDHPDVMQAYDAVKEYSKIKIAFSHPSFEFWLLLHFCSFNVPQDGHNDDVLKRLAGCPGFIRYGRGDKRITEARAEVLRPRIGTAVRSAWALSKQCDEGSCAHDLGHSRGCGPLDQDPSTGMWRLLKSLGVTPLLMQK